jgi:hypothetical protein
LRYSASGQQNCQEQKRWSPQLTFRRGGGYGDVACFRLIAQAGRTLLRPLVNVLGVTRRLAVFIALEAVTLLVAAALVALRVLLRLALPVRLALLLRLIHGVQDPEVMFRVLKESFGGYPVSAARSVSAELQVLFEQLLGGAANTDIRPAAVENVVAIKRNATA